MKFALNVLLFSGSLLNTSSASNSSNSSQPTQTPTYCRSWVFGRIYEKLEQILLSFSPLLSISSTSSISNSSNSSQSPQRYELSPISDFPVLLQNRLAQIRALSDTLMDSEECSDAHNRNYASLLREFCDFCATEGVNPYAMLHSKYPEWDDLVIDYFEDICSYANIVERMGLLQFLDTMTEAKCGPIFIFVNLFAPDYFDKRMVHYGKGVIEAPIHFTKLNLHDFVLKVGAYAHLDELVYTRITFMVIYNDAVIKLLLQLCIKFRRSDKLKSGTRELLWCNSNTADHAVEFCKTLRDPDDYRTILEVIPNDIRFFQRMCIEESYQCQHLLISSFKSKNEFEVLMKFLGSHKGPIVRCELEFLFSITRLRDSNTSNSSQSAQIPERYELSPISDFPAQIHERLGQIRALSDLLMDHQKCSKEHNRNYASLLREFCEFCVDNKVNPYEKFYLRNPEWDIIGKEYFERLLKHINIMETKGLPQFLDALIDAAKPALVFFFVNLFAPDYFDKRMVRYGKGIIETPVHISKLNLHDFVLRTGAYKQLKDDDYVKIVEKVIYNDAVVWLLLQLCLKFPNSDQLKSETRKLVGYTSSFTEHFVKFCRTLQEPEDYRTISEIYPLFTIMGLHKKVIKKDDRCRRLVFSSFKSVDEFDAFIEFLPVQKGSEEWQQFYKLFLNAQIQH